MDANLSTLPTSSTIAIWSLGTDYWGSAQDVYGSSGQEGITTETEWQHQFGGSSQSYGVQTVGVNDFLKFDYSPARNPDEPKKSIISGVPPLDWQSLHDPIFTDVVRKILQRVWAITISKALDTRFPVYKSSVAVFEDPLIEERKAVLHVYCSATAVQAFAFWKSLEEHFQKFLKTLKGNDRETFRRRVDFRIHWR